MNTMDISEAYFLYYLQVGALKARIKTRIYLLPYSPLRRFFVFDYQTYITSIFLCGYLSAP